MPKKDDIQSDMFFRNSGVFFTWTQFSDISHLDAAALHTIDDFIGRIDADFGNFSKC